MSSPDKKEAQASEPVTVYAHQLKAPLSVLKSYLEVLGAEHAGPLTEKQKEYVGNMMENVEKMHNLINMLLDVWRIEDHHYNLDLQPTDFAALVREVVKGIAVWAEKMNTRITLNAPENLEPIMADAEKIRHAVENFIANALEYNEAHSGTLDISIKKAGDGIECSFRDNGIGIPDELKDRVFTKFFRSAHAVKLKPAGTGLGLYTNKAIVELHGGSVWYESNPDGGAIFFMRLPITQKS